MNFLSFSSVPEFSFLLDLFGFPVLAFFFCAAGFFPIVHLYLRMNKFNIIGSCHTFSFL